MKESAPNRDHGAIDPVWAGLTTDPAAGVSIVTANGTILYANKQAVRVFVSDDARPEDIIGKNISIVEGEEWVSERLEVLRHVRDSGRPVLMRTIWKGYQQLSWIHPIDSSAFMEVPKDLPEEDRSAFLVITRRVSGDQESLYDSTPVYDRVDSQVINLGPLGALSPRELEVLALVGQGLSVKEIAAILHRAPKTIENHKASVGKKLEESDRVKLAEISRRAGLSVDDATRTRVGDP